MRVFASIVAVVGLISSGSPAGASGDETPDAYEIAIATAVPILPPPVRSFFEVHIAALRRNATGEISRASASESGAGPAEWHYVMLDVTAGDGDSAKRRAAALAFPRDHAAAKALFERHGRRNGGSLPWVIERRYGALVQAFRSGQMDTIIRDAGVLLHFTTDAALPFNTTANRDGGATGHLRWSSGAEVNSLHRTVRHRCQLGLVKQLRARLDYEVRVAPERLRPIADPVDAAFDALLEAHGALDTLLASDADAMASLDIEDSRGFEVKSNAYYDCLAASAAPTMEARLEAAALLGANLVAAAWLEAGSPQPSTWTAAPAPGEDRGVSTERLTAPYVGSLHSKVLHRATCTHAKRIKPANLVRFKTLEEAYAAGRIPCKTCRPDTP